MPRLINADALLLRIDCHGTNKFGMLDEDIRAFINDAPTIDAVPVVHGEWIVEEFEIDGYNHERHRCSVCGDIMPHTIFLRKYCPNCGARMDGDENG